MRNPCFITKGRVFRCVVLLFILMQVPLLASDERVQAVYLFPVAEMKGILTQWLIDRGFTLSRQSEDNGQVLLHGFRENEQWQFILKPYSALGSHMEASYSRNGTGDTGKIEELQRYLNAYTTDNPEQIAEEIKDEQKAPDAVMSRRELVVCIEADIRGTPLQFTGFIIDRQGLVISTAHDLKDVKTVVVHVNNGKEIMGTIARIDYLRDLTLIQLNREFSTSVSLWNGRHRVESGEEVFSITCPSQGNRYLYTGIVNRTIGIVNNLPLLWATMETLPGSSGSPVFDKQGNFIGVVKGRYRGTDSSSFLIPRETVIDFLKQE